MSPPILILEVYHAMQTSQTAHYYHQGQLELS